MAFLSTFCRVTDDLVWIRKRSKTAIAFGGFLMCVLSNATADPGALQPFPYQQVGAAARPFIPVVQSYLRRGYYLYNQKDGCKSLQQSLCFFDTANTIAQRLQDTALLAETTCAIAHFYDGWNEDPQKTISLLKQALLYMEAKSSNIPRLHYTRYLLARAYVKAGENATAFVYLEQLLTNLSPSDTALLHKMPFTVEMAFTAVEAGNVGLANRILTKLTRREWIANEPQNDNYLDHYYLTRAYIDAMHGKKESPYLDSFRHALKTEPVLFNKRYYAKLLADYYKLNGNYALAFHYLEYSETLDLLLHAQEERSRFSELLASTEAKVLNRQQKVTAAIQTPSNTALWVLDGLVLVIAGLSFYFYGQNQKFRQQSKQLQHANQVLDGKVAQVELRSQEVEHRVKNNLYAVQSLLELQSRQALGEEAAASLQIAQMRVASVALLYNMLLQGKGTLRFEVFAQALFKNIIACYADEREVTFSLEVEDSPLPESTYSPLSLMLNEWVTNSVKYAQTNGSALRLFLSLKKVPQVGILITYHDNGVLSPHQRAPVTGLGSKIISMLAHQMGATLLQESLFYYQITLPHE